MNTKQKWAVALVLLAGGGALIGWNLRDPDRGKREPVEEERELPIAQTPAAVQATIKRVSAGGKIEEVQEEREGDRVTYEVDVIKGDTKTEYEISVDGSVIKEKSKKLKPEESK